MHTTLAFLAALVTTVPPPEPAPLAPEFPSGLHWINVAQPLTMSALRGKVVLLDFWTYCCINCMQVIPDLQALEEEFGGRGLVVVGVHSGKFDNEKDPDNIRSAVRRYGVRHPVVDDSEFRIWDAYGVHAWPTLYLVGADGRVIGYTTGEGHKAQLARDIGAALERAKKAGVLDDKPLAVATQAASAAQEGALAFPSKLLAKDSGDAKQRRLFVADTNHDRVLELTLEGKVLAVFGSGKTGAVDGPAATASFHQPQGLAQDGDTLYVADTANHLVRAIDLKQRSVRTVAGNGRRGRDTEGLAVKAALASPWDVAMLGGKLYIANSGTHQLLAFDPSSGSLTLAAGSGHEGLKDGDALGAWLAQPSGLATDGSVLYFADAEVSSVRLYDPKTKRVDTLVGKGLFDFGDVDGKADKARLQHCLGLSYYDHALIVADTYNHKIKRLTLGAEPMLETLIGSGKPGHAQSTLYEPGGVTSAQGKLYVADTNNSRVLVIDAKTRAAKALTISGLP